VTRANILSQRKADILPDTARALSVELLFSGTGRLRNVEAVLQHLEARHDIARNGRMIANCVAVILPVALIPGLERTNDRGAALAGQDVLDLKVTGSVSARIRRMKIGDRLAAGLAADPGQHPIIRLDLESEIGVERGGDLSRIPFTAIPSEASVQ